jgi:4-cresol dehydrogenase (hydroxylating)
MAGNNAEMLRLRGSGGASDEQWERYAASAGGAPFWAASFVYYGARNVIAAQWQHTKDRLAGIVGVQFRETASHTFPLTDEQVEAVADKARYGIPSLNLFGSRTAPGAPPLEGHMDFSPMIPPHGEELIALTDYTGKVYADQGFTPSFVGGLMFHPRTMICFHAVPTFRNAADNARTRKLFETLVRGCAERGWPIYRIHPVFQKLGMEMFGFNGGALHRLHETLKDAIDPNGIVSPGRYDIWPKRLRGTRA